MNTEVLSTLPLSLPFFPSYFSFVLSITKLLSSTILSLSHTGAEIDLAFFSVDFWGRLGKEELWNTPES